MEQEQRLDYLVEMFKEDSGEYKNLEVGSTREEKGIKSVAFCCISTGEFHFPNDEAAKIAVETVNSILEQHPDSFNRVIFNVFKEIDKELYKVQYNCQC